MKNRSHHPASFRSRRESLFNKSDNKTSSLRHFSPIESQALARADVPFASALHATNDRHPKPRSKINLPNLGHSRCQKIGTSRHGSCKRAYILLETVVATGVLVVGLGVIGAQIQGATDGVRSMERRVQAMMLAEMKLAELDLGLVELESFDEVEESDFGPRYPDWGWRLITEKTGLDQMFSLTLEVLYAPHEDDYKEDSFDHDIADLVFSLHAMRSGPRPLDLGADFGLDEERFDEVSAQLDDLGIEGLDASSLDPSILAKLDIQDFLEVLPILADVLGIDVSDLSAGLPPELRSLLDGLNGDQNAPEGQGGDSNSQIGEQTP